MTRPSLFLLSILVAAPATAQSAPATPPARPFAPPPEFIQSAQAFGLCIDRAVGQAPVTATPEAAAHQAVLGCAAEKKALDTRFEGWVASPNFPDAGRARAHARYAEQMSGLEMQVAERIRQQRATAAPSPAPSPTPPR